MCVCVFLYRKSFPKGSITMNRKILVSLTQPFIMCFFLVITFSNSNMFSHPLKNILDIKPFPITAIWAQKGFNKNSPWSSAFQVPVVAFALRIRFKVTRTCSKDVLLKSLLHKVIFTFPIWRLKTFAKTYILLFIRKCPLRKRSSSLRKMFLL